MAGIYIHIPFCKQACHYCDFHFSTNRTHQHQLVDALIKELIIQKHYLTNEIRTIYFGGGTPSLLSSNELRSILSTIRSHFNVTSMPEITLEANPDDLSKDNTLELSAAGINRLSIGIQSFQDDLLRYLNRAHSSTTAIESFQYARQAGFSNISIDLIYAIPGLSDDQWRKEIRKAIELGPEHISAYSLTIEEKTVFGHRAAKGGLVAVDDDSSARQLDILVDELQTAGFEHYEVSNFCRPGFQSRHNSSYWKQEKYLGIGPSSHSYNGESRQFNIKNNALYVKAIEDGNIPFEREILQRHDHINEYLMTTLRTSWGSEIAKLKTDHDFDIMTQRGMYINDLIDRNLATVDGGFLKLTKAGRLMADKIASDLFVVPD